jgi:hypothetical protein
MKRYAIVIAAALALLGQHSAAFSQTSDFCRPMV